MMKMMILVVLMMLVQHLQGGEILPLCGGDVQWQLYSRRGDK